jgi:5-methylcytosine-specific restriction enzyme subunit McrC
VKSILIPEWGTQGVACSLDPAESRLAEALTKSGRMQVLELAHGLEIHTTSYVGRISLGKFTVTIHPKISGVPLLSLFRYAYGLRNLDLYGDVDFAWSDWSFQDLLVHQLIAEVSELLERGIHREYERRSADLASPRGRIDFARYVHIYRSAKATLPCVHHPRIEDTRLNRVLLAGLNLGVRLAIDQELRGRAQRVAKILSSTVSDVPLTSFLMADAWRKLDRRTAAYEHAFRLIELLVDGQGIALSDQANPIRLNGFLFDMNRFFQALISRFLCEHLDGVEVRDEFRIKGMFRYEPGYNPRDHRRPVLRPDFALLRNAEMVTVLDAKYRDLWEQPLPPEILYQLALYALAHTSKDRWAAIIYPSLDPKAREQRIAVHDPVRGMRQACVALRPLNLLELDRLLRSGHSAYSRRIALAEALAFGQPVAGSASLAA